MNENIRAALRELSGQLQQCRQSVMLFQSVVSARNVLLDERDGWNARDEKSDHVISHRILTEFHRKIAELDAEYTKILAELLHLVNTIAISLPQLGRRVVHGPFARWREGQKAAQIGFPEQAELRQDAESCLRGVTSSVYATLDILEQIQSAYASNDETADWIRTKWNEFRRYLRHLLQTSFVICKQPPMLVKDWTLRMDLSVKILADVPTYGGNKNLRRGPVNCCMITEKQAESLTLQQESIDFSQAPINAWSFGSLSSGSRVREAAKDSCIKAEWNDVTGEAEFTAVRTKIDNRKTNESKDKAAGLEADNRSDDKKPEKITEKKLYFLFFFKIVASDESTYWIWALSLPFLVAVQTMQEWHLLGVIFWDTAFSALDAIPCNGKEQVSWGELKIVLKWLFDKQVQTETENSSTAARELTDEELNHLGTRIFGPGREFNDESTLSRADVFEKPVGHTMTSRKGHSDQKGFTFWQWFYGCMDLLEDRAGRILRYHNGKTSRKRCADAKRTMATLFNEGIIRGFVSRETTERLLQSCPRTNIMLIRFSDNHCRHEDQNSVPAGYISITCKAAKDGRDTIVNIKPLNRDVLSRLTLPFVVAHCEYLNNVQYVYIGENRWVEKTRLTINYIPILTEYTQYEGYEKLLLNFNSDNHSEESPVNTPPHSSLASPPSSVFGRSHISTISDYSPQSAASGSGNGNASCQEFVFENPHNTAMSTTLQNGRQGGESFVPKQLIELLSEPPSRRAALPSKYDEVLSYLISGTESALSPNMWSEFQPEDDATLCRSLSTHQ